MRAEEKDTYRLLMVNDGFNILSLNMGNMMQESTRKKEGDNEGVHEPVRLNKQNGKRKKNETKTNKHWKIKYKCEVMPTERKQNQFPSY